MVAEFRDMLTKMKVTIDEAGWQKDLVFIKAMIRYEIDFDLFGAAESRRRLSEVDPQVQAALGLFPEAEKLSELRRSGQKQAQN